MAKGFQTQIKSEQKKKQSLIVESFENSQEKLLSYVEEVEDPRVNRTQKHLLKDILTIAILAAIAGAEGWEDIENYGISKYSWLKEFLELPNGIPSDDTFRRVFERIRLYCNYWISEVPLSLLMRWEHRPKLFNKFEKIKPIMF